MSEIEPAEMKSAQQTDTSNEEIAESDQVMAGKSEIGQPEIHRSIDKEISDVEEAVVECLPVDEGGQMKDNTDNSVHVSDQENLAPDDSNICVYTETESATLVGSMPGNTNIETDSDQKPDMHVAVETSDENSKTNNMALVAQDDNELTDSSSGTVNKLPDNCDVAIHVIPPNGDIENETEDYDNFNDCSNNIEEDVSEDLCDKSSSAEVSLITETTKETEGEERGDTQLNVDNDSKLPENESVEGDSGGPSLNLEIVDAEDNTDVLYKGLDEYDKAELEQYSPQCDGDEAVVTHRELVKAANEEIVSAEICKSSDHNQNEVDVEKATTAESPELDEEIQPDESTSEGVLSSNVGALEREMDGRDPGTVLKPAADVEQAEAVDKEVCGESALDDAIVLQRVDAGKSISIISNTC